jgi:glutathione S-transferase
MGVATSYLYPVGVMQLFVQRIMAPIMGGEPDEAVVADAAAIASQHLDVLEQELTAPFLVGQSFSLADGLAGAMVDYIAMTQEGVAMLQTRPKTAAWLETLRQRDSFRQTFASLLAGKAQV